MKFNIGDRVYYGKNGDFETGTITRKVENSPYAWWVKWESTKQGNYIDELWATENELLTQEEYDSSLLR